MTDAPRPPWDGQSGSTSPDPNAPPPYAPPPAGSYNPPPAQQGFGSAPPPGYPPAGYTPGTPPGYATNDEKTWALIAHFGGAAGAFIGGGAGGWIAPLIALLTRGNQSPTVRAHAVAALNFQIVWSIIAVLGWITLCLFVGVLGILAAYAMGIIFGIIAGLKANEGQLYKYPMSVQMIK